jgi:cyclophilin family peptidyl-prolyl cis-trans isomerase
MVTSCISDNRGEVQITLNGQANPATVTRTSVQMYTAGDDEKLGTSDDVKVRAPVGWSANAKRITVRGNLPPNTKYRIRLVSSRLLDLSGRMLDGEFKGVFPAGNSKPGGNFDVQTRDDVSNNPTVRLNTTEGVINLKMYRGIKPITVANFLSYADSGRYDNIFWTRSVANFVIQTGGLQIDPEFDIVTQAPADSPIVNEFDDNGVISNRRGTVAFAKQTGDPNSAMNEFFMNVQDNGGDDPYSLDEQNGGFTVFAQLADAASYAVMDAIGGFPTVALHNPVSAEGILPDYSPVTLTDVPVRDPNLLTGEVQTVEVPPDPFPPRTQFVVKEGLDPARDLIIVRRTSLLMKVVRT